MALPTANILAEYIATLNRYNDAGTTLASVGDSIQQWNDQRSVGPYHLTQATLGNRPKLRTIGGADAIDFSMDITSPYMGNASMPIDARASSFMGVFALQGNPASETIWNANGSTPILYINATGFAQALAAVSVFKLPGNWCVIGQRNGSASQRISVNSKYQDITANGVASVTGVEVGRQYGTANTLTLKAACRHIAIWSAALSDADWLLALAYFYATYTDIPTAPTNLLVCDGDSLTAGAFGLGSTYPLQLAALLGPTWQVHNLGITGTTIQALAGLSGSTAQIELLALPRQLRKRITIIWAGTNDIVASRTGAQISADYSTYAKQRKSAGDIVVGATIIARTALSGPQATARTDANTAIKANTDLDYVVDLAADSRLSNSADTTYYAADGVHLNAVGYGVVAALVKATLDTIPGPSSGGLLVSSGMGGGMNG